MNRAIVACLAAMALSGCVTASTSDALKRPVDEVFHLSQSPEQVTACFEKANFHVAERADGSRVAVIRNGYGGVAKAFSLYPEGTGTRIETRHVFIGMPAFAVKRCLSDSGY